MLWMLAGAAHAYCLAGCLEEEAIWVYDTPECEGNWYEDGCRCACDSVSEPTEGQACPGPDTTSVTDTASAACVFATWECLEYDDGCKGNGPFLSCGCASEATPASAALLALASLLAVGRRSRTS